ncbi:MAG: hypothetical protein R3B09_02440 [Nannocystaceae bacterium]
MAGPTFTFLYRPRDAPTLDTLARALHGLRLDVRVGATELALHGDGVGSLFVGVGPSPAFTAISDAEAEALALTLGGIPSVEVHGYAMANGAADWAALRRIAVRIADRLGGLAPQAHDPGAIAGVVRVEHRDLVAYFGPMLGDDAYVRAHAHRVPPVVRYFVPARAIAAACVRK